MTIAQLLYPKNDVPLPHNNVVQNANTKKFYLTANGELKDGDWQKAFWGSEKYLGNSEKYSHRFQLDEKENGDSCIKISYPESYLAVDTKVKGNDEKMAFCETKQYLEKNTSYPCTFKLIESGLGTVRIKIKKSDRFLATTKDEDWNWAFFGTKEAHFKDKDKYLRDFSVDNKGNIYVSFNNN